MDTVPRYLHTQSLAARFCLLLALYFIGATQAHAVVAAGEWQNADDLSISQGDRFYDRSLRVYYTYNTVTAAAGGSLSGDLRLVVQSNSHTVLNADGEVDGKPYFTVPGGSAEHVVRINFQRMRAAFAYTTQMQRYVEVLDPDDDGDSVPNSSDICPNTPAGEAVDAEGCSESQKDDDGDSVVNSLDQCPNTPTGEAVDAEGCSESQKDDDGDSVANSLDQCPNTPTGEAVDAEGCSESQKDDDGDSVANSLDQCPNTPAGEDVDANGCSESQLDEDNDGFVNSEDFCLNDATNTCITVEITVRGGGTPLPGVAVVVGIDAPGGATTSSETNADGVFVPSVGHPGGIGDDGLDFFLPISAAIDGFATGFAKVVLAPDVFEYAIDIDLAPVSDIIGDDEDVAAGVSIEKEEETVGKLTIPEGAFPEGVTEIKGQITYLDPEGDIALTPGGDLLALPEGADPNEPVPLETFGMMEFDLVDQDGNAIHDLGGEAEVCMKAGAGLSLGDTIPLWYYDNEAGLWIEEGEGTVVDRDGVLMLCGGVTHFSWWNYDQPITTHACFKYHFVDGDSGESLRNEFDWYAEGETYNGSSPERLCDRDGNDPATPAPNDDSIDSLTVKRTTDSANPEQIRVTTTIGGSKYYLVDDGDGTYSLSTDVVNAAVFNNPELNASCLNNTNVSDCLFLDYKEGVEANGILPLDVDGINFAPVISDFNSDIGYWGNLAIGSSTSISALVADPEGSDLTIAWSSQCYGTGQDNGVLTPAAASGTSGVIYTSQFTAPAALTRFYAYCDLAITATDAEGNSAMASHRLRITDASLALTVQGTVYGTDGEPLPFHTLELTSWSCSGSSLPITTDALGAYQVEVTNLTCEGGDYFDYQLYSDFTYESSNGESSNWNYYSDLYHCFGEGSEGDVTGDLLCEHDVHFPTVWAPLSGTVSDGVSDLGLDTYISDYPWAYVSRNVELNGPNYSLMVPLGQGYMWGWDANAAEWYYRSFNPLSTDGLVADFGSATGSATVTVFDNGGLPLSNAVVTGWTDNGNNSIDATTDVNGQLELADLPLGSFWLTITGAGNTYYANGMLNLAGEHIDVDVNSSDSCDIVGTAYDLFGQLAVGVDINAWINNGNTWSSITTQSDASGAFMLSGALAGGYIYLHHGNDFNNWAGSFTVNNCRPDVNGNPPRIRVDVPERYNRDYVFFE